MTMQINTSRLFETNDEQTARELRAGIEHLEQLSARQAIREMALLADAYAWAQVGYALYISDPGTPSAEVSIEDFDKMSQAVAALTAYATNNGVEGTAPKLGVSSAACANLVKYQPAIARMQAEYPTPDFPEFQDGDGIAVTFKRIYAQAIGGIMQEMQQVLDLLR